MWWSGQWGIICWIQLLNHWIQVGLLDVFVFLNKCGHTVNAVNFADKFSHLAAQKHICGLLNSHWADAHLSFSYSEMPTFSNRKKVFLEGKKRIFWPKKVFFENCIWKFDLPHPTHFSSGTCRDRSPLHPAAVNATVCSLPLAMQLHARNCSVGLSINVALIMPKKY